MRAALLILGKDLRLRARDRTVWILGLAAPLLLAGILGLVIGGFEAESLAPPRWGTVDLDGGDLGASLIDGVVPAAGDDLDATITAFADREQAVAAIVAGDVDAVFLAPRGLSESAAGLAPLEVEVIGESGILQFSVAKAIADRWAAEVDVRRQGVLAAVAQGAEVDVQMLDLAALEVPQLLSPTSLGSQDRTLDGTTYVAVGMAVFFLFFTVQLGVVGLLEERSQGTLSRLRAAPIPGWSVLLGKILTSLVIGWLSTAVLVAATTLFLGASWGPTVPVLVLVTAATLAAVSLVTVVAGFTGSVDAASNAQAVIAIVLGMLGGAFFPIATEPGLLATLSDLTPHGMFLTGVADLRVPGAGLRDIAPQLLGLLAFGAALSAAATGLTHLREVQ